MLEIYFDGVLLDPIYYMSFTQKWVMFDKEFKLGVTPCREFELVVPKSVWSSPTEIKVRYNNEDYAYLIVDDVQYDENNSIPKAKITLVDKMVKADFNYDASSLVPCTLKDIVEDICDKMGVELGNQHFTNEDLTIDYYDNTITAREYLSYISEMAGGFVRIENDGKLWIRTFDNNTTNEINPDLCEKIILGQRHQIERVVFDNGLLKLETSQDDTLETLYLNPINVYINSQTEFNNIANNILGFTYYNLDTGNVYIFSDTMCGDVLKLIYNGTTYYTIQNTPSLKFMGIWQGAYQLNIESQEQSETAVYGINTQVKGIKIKQNRDENTLSIAVEDIQTQKDITNPNLDSKISANTTLIQQTAGEIRSEVSSSEGILQGNIDEVQGNLDSKEIELKGLIQDNTTLIQQLKDAIISTIKTTGGNNLLRNSVGYSGTDFWDKTGTITTNQDDNMSLSGSEFILTGASTLSQVYSTQPGTKYSVSFKYKHTAVGTANQIKVELIGQGTTKTILDTTETFDYWNEVRLEEPYTASVISPTIKITCTGDDIFEITDLIVALGENNVWSGYFDEVYGKEHKLDRNGLRLSNLAGNNSSKTTANSIQMLEGSDVVAELSKNVVSSNTSVIKKSHTVGRLETIVLDNNNIIEYIMD